MAQPRRAPSEDALLKLPKKSYKKSTRPSSEDEWITLIRRERERRLDLRKKHELTWTLNLAYYMGFQNLLYDRSSGLLRIQNGSSQPLTVNRIGSPGRREPTRGEISREVSGLGELPGLGLRKSRSCP